MPRAYRPPPGARRSAGHTARGRSTGPRARSAAAAGRRSVDRLSAVSTSPIRPGATTRPSSQQQRMADAHRDLLDVVGDQHHGRGVGVRGERRPAGAAGPRGRRGPCPRPARRAAAAPDRSSGPGRSAPACARPRSACRRCGRRGGRRRSGAAAPGPPHVESAVGLPPPADDGVAGGDDDVDDLLPPGSAGPARPRRARSAAAARTRRRRRAARRARATVPQVGYRVVAASCSSVVLPAPFGPSTTHRSSSSTAQSTASSSTCRRAAPYRLRCRIASGSPAAVGARSTTPPHPDPSPVVRHRSPGRAGPLEVSSAMEPSADLTQILGRRLGPAERGRQPAWPGKTGPARARPGTARAPTSRVWSPTATSGRRCACSTAGNETRLPLAEHQLPHLARLPARHQPRSALRLAGRRPLRPGAGRATTRRSCWSTPTPGPSTATSSTTPPATATTTATPRRSCRARWSCATTSPGAATAAARRPGTHRHLRAARQGLHRAPPRHPGRAARHLRRAGPPGGDRLPQGARRHRGRAAAGAPLRHRADAAAARADELLGLQHPRVLRPARRLRHPAAGSAASRCASSRRWSGRCTPPASRSSSTWSTTTPPRPAAGRPDLSLPRHRQPRLLPHSTRPTPRYVDYTGCGNTLDVRPPAVAAADHGLAALLGDRDARRRLPLRPGLGAGPLAARRRQAVGLLRHHPPGPGRQPGETDRRAVGRRRRRLPGRRVPAAVDGVERQVPRHRAGLLAPAAGGVRDLAYRLSGSTDLYADDGRRPYASINFVTAHDGFTLRDLVVLRAQAQRGQRRGQPRRHRRQPLGTAASRARPTTRRVNALRRRQVRNLLATLLLSTGVPMLVAGDERCRTQGGNNNAYCQDNEISWLDWTDSDAGRRPARAVPPAGRAAPALPVLRQRAFFEGRPVRRRATAARTWPGSTPTGAEMTGDWFDAGARTIGMYLDGRGLRDRGPRGEVIIDDSFLLILHAGDDAATFALPGRAVGRRGTRCVVDTTAAVAADEVGVGGRRRRDDHRGQPFACCCCGSPATSGGRTATARRGAGPHAAASLLRRSGRRPTRRGQCPTTLGPRTGRSSTASRNRQPARMRG